MRSSSWPRRVFLSFALLSAPSHAHLTLTEPPARHPASDLKYGPCGVEGADQRTTDPARITTYEAGETITVTWTEVVDHDPSHYRVAFSSSNDSFEDPTGFDDIRSGYPILLDGIPDADAGRDHVYSVEVTLPNEPCDTCSLQVIQVMHDKPPWGPDGGEDIYYQCADIVLLEISTDPAPPSDPGAGGSAGSEMAGEGASATSAPTDVPGGDDEVAQEELPEDSSSEGASSDSGGCSLARPERSTGSAWLLAAAALFFAQARRRCSAPSAARN